jgi:hypothetical protein
MVRLGKELAVNVPAFRFFYAAAAAGEASSDLRISRRPSQVISRITQQN